jgi:hypothetical protein
VVHGGAYGGDVWAGGGEFREEGGCVFAVVSEAAAGFVSDCLSVRGGMVIIWIIEGAKMWNSGVGYHAEVWGE